MEININLRNIQENLGTGKNVTTPCLTMVTFKIAIKLELKLGLKHFETMVIKDYLV